MPTKEFPKEEMLDMLYGRSEKLELVKDEIVDHARWSIVYMVVFEEKETGKFYTKCYRVGATEYQDEQPWEYESDEIFCREVEPVYVTRTEYQHVRGGE